MTIIVDVHNRESRQDLWFENRLVYRIDTDNMTSKLWSSV